MYTHPQFVERELHISIIYTQNKSIINNDKYLLLESENDSLKVILPKPINEFINEIFFNLEKKISKL